MGQGLERKQFDGVPVTSGLKKRGTILLELKWTETATAKHRTKQTSKQRWGWKRGPLSPTLPALWSLVSTSPGPNPGEKPQDSQVMLSSGSDHWQGARGRDGRGIIHLWSETQKGHILGQKAYLTNLVLWLSAIRLLSCKGLEVWRKMSTNGMRQRSLVRCHYATLEMPGQSERSVLQMYLW